MKIYVLIDDDMNTVWGTYSTLGKIFEALTYEMIEEYNTMNVKKDEDDWVITIPHDDPEHAAHFHIIECTLDDGQE